MPSEIYAITILFGLLGLLAWRTRHATPGPRRLRVLESAALGQGRTVAIIEAGNKRLLVGVTAQSIATLADLGPVEVPSVVAGPLRLEPVESEAP